MHKQTVVENYDFMGIVRYCLIILGIALAINESSCVKGDEAIGSQFMNSDVNVKYIDSLTVNFSSFLMDSIISSNKNLALVGSYVDPESVFGVTQSTSYVIFNTPGLVSVGNSSGLLGNAVYDSLILTLKYSGLYYGDTLQPLKFSLHRVNQDIVFPTSSQYLYNTSSFSYDADSIGEIEILPRPNSDQTVTIKLAGSLGAEFLDKLANGSDELASQDNFVNYFKGIAFVADPTNSSIVGFNINSTSMYMNLYYHNEGDVVNVSRDVQFNPCLLDHQFNHIYSNRTNSPLTKDLSNVPTNSSNTGNYSFVQGGTGIVTRVDFPYLSSLLKYHPNMQVLRAVLVVQPVVPQNLDYLPSNLNLYFTNKFNDFVSIVNDSNGNAEGGNLNVDGVIPSNSTYSWDVTTFVNTVLGTNSSNLNGLLIVPNNYSVSFDHAVIADPLRSHYNTKLILYIASHE